MKRKSILGKRFYEVSEDSRKIVLPSVTSVISNTSDKTWLYEWRKKIGSENADKISNRSTARGNLMHYLLEIYTVQSGNKQSKLNLTFDIVRESELYKKSSPEVRKLGVGLFYNIYHSGLLDNIQKTHFNERRIFNIVEDFKTIPIGYSGTVDHAHWDSDGNYKIIDFKTSRKIKQESQITNYKEQLAAYTIALCKKYEERPKQVEIWISVENFNTPQVFVLNHKDIINYYKQFEKRLYLFYEKYKQEIVNHYKEHLNK